MVEEKSEMTFSDEIVSEKRVPVWCIYRPNWVSDVTDEYFNQSD